MDLPVDLKQLLYTIHTNLEDTEVSMLAKGASVERLHAVLRPIENWTTVSPANERTGWAHLPDDLRAILIRNGERHIGSEWPPLQATRALEFAREGNRSRYEAASFGRRSVLQDLVIAECVEWQGRFLDDIVNGVWAICEESYWGVPAHLGLQKAGGGLPDTTEPTVDLFAAETGATLAWTLHLIGVGLDSVSPLVHPRIENEIRHRILGPCHEREDFWWMGFSGERRVNNWNPWICSNWLVALLAVESDSHLRAVTVHKILRALDNYIEGCPGDGGCDEGPSYWGVAGASLFDCLDILHAATDGAIDVFGEPLIRDMGAYIYRVHIQDRYFVNFADAPGRWSAPAALCYQYGRRTDDEGLVGFAAEAWRASDPASRTRDRTFTRRLRTCFFWGELEAKTDAAAPYVADAFLPDIQVAAARDEKGSPGGWYIAAKGGHNNEHHNHNDVGNVIVYRDGKPLLVDAGVGTYTAKTFSPQRYDIWTMQSAYHNLPTINGTQQSVGEAFAAKAFTYKAEGSSAEISLDLAEAWPAKAGVRAWVRTVVLERGREVRVTDTWDLQSDPESLTLSLLTPCEATVSDRELTLGGRIIREGVESASAVIEYNAERLAPSLESVAIDPDDRLAQSWGGFLTRILFEAVDPSARGSWTIRIH